MPIDSAAFEAPLPKISNSWMTLDDCTTATILEDSGNVRSEVRSGLLNRLDELT
jgi:hypothetical protein